MSRTRCFQLATFCCLAVLAIGGLSNVYGGKKGSPPPPPPPPPPADPFQVYEWHPELGGWLDKNTNLVWGYSFIDMLGTSTHSGYGIKQQAATNAAAHYADVLYSMPDQLEGSAADITAQADVQIEKGDAALAAGDIELAARFYAAAQAKYLAAQDDLDSIPIFIAAADVADQFTWRLPTQQEAETAIANGLFTYGEGGFNGYDGSPRIGLSIPWNNLTWTSTLSKSKKQAWAYRPMDGGYGFIGITSTVNCMFVRTHVP